MLLLYFRHNIPLSYKLHVLDILPWIYLAITLHIRGLTVVRNYELIVDIAITQDTNSIEESRTWETNRGPHNPFFLQNQKNPDHALQCYFFKIRLLSYYTFIYPSAPQMTFLVKISN
jgi:hypothetical protein